MEPTKDRRTAAHSALSASQRKLRAQAAANARWSRQDPVEGTRAARRAFRERFALDVDPDGKLPADERMRRAEAAYRAHMQWLSYRASQSREDPAGRRETNPNSLPGHRQEG